MVRNLVISNRKILTKTKRIFISLVLSKKCLKYCGDYNVHFTIISIDGFEPKEEFLFSDIAYLFIYIYFLLKL